MWSAPLVLASCKIFPYVVLGLVVVLGVCFRMSLCKLACSSARLCVVGVLSFLGTRSFGHVRSPLIGGSASVNVISGVLCPSTTPLAALSASSL